MLNVQLICLVSTACIACARNPTNRQYKALFWLYGFAATYHLIDIDRVRVYEARRAARGRSHIPLVMLYWPDRPQAPQVPPPLAPPALAPPLPGLASLTVPPAAPSMGAALLPFGPRSPPTTTLIHIVVAADRPLWPGVAGVVRSALASSGTPHILRFHLVTLAEQAADARAAMSCFGVESQLVVHALPGDVPQQTVRVTASAAVTGHLASPLNFVRFYLPRVLPPHVERVLYLDADVVVRADLRELWAAPLAPSHAVAAVPRPEAHFRYARYVKRCDGLYASRHGGTRLNGSAPTFNAGVALIDLRRWAAAGLTSEAEWWMARHLQSDDGLWALGSQPVMHLILHGNWSRLPADWNADGLGRVTHMDGPTLRRAKLLHWTGRRKPWRADGLHTEHFTRHVSVAQVRRCVPEAAASSARGGR